ncbi:hypothetical protein [Pseudomonas sp. OTU750018]|nr:hypothetical protein [Pseudomonas sp. OTU750018]
MFLPLTAKLVVSQILTDLARLFAPPDMAVMAPVCPLVIPHLMI